MEKNWKQKLRLGLKGMTITFQNIFGWFMLIVFLFGVIGAISTNDTVVLVVCLVFMLIGIILIINSKRKRKIMQLFDVYMSVISNDQLGTIDKIAAKIGTTEDVVRKNIKLMIRKKYFIGAYLDLENNRVVLKNQRYEGGIQYDKYDPNNTKIKQEHYIEVRCNNCGGGNKVRKGISIECEFCGSLIQQ